MSSPNYFEHLAGIPQRPPSSVDPSVIIDEYNKITRGSVDIVLGAFFGDEGKGKIVDALAGNYSTIARSQGGGNAGHTLMKGGKKIVLHTLPSGIVTPGTENVLGAGVVIDPVGVMQELEDIANFGVNDTNDRLKISDQANLILPTHRLLDQANEQSKGNNKIGSTGKGIGPAYSDHTARDGLYMYLLHDENEFKDAYDNLKAKHVMILRAMGFDVDNAKIDGKDFEEYEKEWFQGIKKLKEYESINVSHYMNNVLSKGNNVLAEGAQGVLLDIMHGTYPFVTSSNTGTAGVLTGLGISHKDLGIVTGISKAYSTRVGAGPFPTLIGGELGEFLGDKGQEFGATTGRRRATGWLDLVALKHAIFQNGIDEIALTKLDILSDFEKVLIATGYVGLDGEELEHFPSSAKELAQVTPIYEGLEGWTGDISNARRISDLPENAQLYIKRIEEEIGIPIKLIGVGPDNEELIVRK